MANTLNLGTGGNWAAKEGSLLAYNNENGNFKPLPFDFTRASSATRVNSQGLIEVVGSDQPRVDFSNDTDGALLLEPQRTNFALYSEQFDNAYWTKSAGTTITANTTISPDGYTNADTIAFASTGDSVNLFISTGLSVVSGTAYTMSVFTKSTTQVIYIGGATGGTGTNVYNGSVDYGNGWYRQSITRTWSASGTVNVQLVLTLTGSGSTIAYGFQAELGSYATSYIPTQGAAVTRVDESSLQGGFQDKNIFGSTQGTVVLEFKWDLGGYVFDLNDNLGVRLRIFDDGSTWKIRDFANASWVNTGFSKSNNVKTKIAFKWNGTQFTSFQDGVKSSSTDGFASSMAINSITTNKLNNKSNMQFYNTALTDAELIALTTI